MRKINKVAIIGSGIMGSRIACHFANIGIEVLLLDILNEEKADKKRTPASRNKIVNESLQHTLKSKPAPIYSKNFYSRITTGNLTDDLSKIDTVDWIIEVIIENIEIKKKLFENIEKYRSPGTIISSNTSGIPINNMIEGRTEPAMLRSTRMVSVAPQIPVRLIFAFITMSAAISRFAFSSMYV